MMHLVTGGSGSGKSAYAEELLTRSGEIQNGKSESEKLQNDKLQNEKLQSEKLQNDKLQNENLQNEKTQSKKQQKYVYIATMRPYGAETMKKIERHYRLRAGKGFQTIECYQDLESVHLPENEGVLLECMSNLLANEYYREDGTLNDSEAVKNNILQGIENIKKQTSQLVIVTNEVGSDINGYSEETKKYIALLDEINQVLARCADTVTEVVYGIPVEIKA